MQSRGPDRQLRQFPWMTDEDFQALLALPEEEGKVFEAFLLVQARAERRFRRHVTIEADLPGDSDGSAVESIAGARAARYSHGAGGGRIRGHDNHREAA